MCQKPLSLQGAHTKYATSVVEFWKLLPRTRTTKKVPAPDWVYRGVSDFQFDLKPSLLRKMENIKITNERDAIKIERDLRSCIEKILPKIDPNFFHTYLSDGRDTSHVWAYMQHYGAPTRLLDWSRNPMVATYFAVREHLDKDAYVWCLNVRKLRLAMNHKGNELIKNPLRKKLGKPGAFSGIIHYLNQRYETGRSYKQSGGLTLAEYILDDHGAILSNLNNPNIFIGILIPFSLKEDLLRNLYRRDIWAYELFPDSAGVCESMKERLQYRHAKCW